MRYIIYGSGGIGSAIGGMLAYGHRDSILITRSEHARAINEFGLTIVAPNRQLNIRVKAITNLADLKPAQDDCILLTVKTYDTARALIDLSHWAGEKSQQIPILCLQNGISNEILAAQ